MARRLLSIILGLILGSTVMSLAHGLLMAYDPMPGDIDQNDMEAMKAYIKTFSFTKLHLASLGHAIGAMTAGFVACWFAKENRFSAGVLALLVFTGMTIMNDVVLDYAWSDTLIDVALNLLLGYAGATAGKTMKIPFKEKW